MYGITQGFQKALEEPCEHRWNPWRRIVMQYDSMCGIIATEQPIIATLSGGDPATPGWTRTCSKCFTTENSHGTFTEGTEH